MTSLMYILWDPDQIIFSLGSFAIRWYSTFWLIGLLGAYFLVRYVYKQQKVADEKFEPLFLYSFLGILIGARLGHCLFYEPEHFLSSWTHFIEMFVPMRQGMDGSWHFTGYEGLASHGGTLGIMLALILYCRNMKMGKLWVMDVVCLAVPITACCIRLGNLMNSEIIGRVTDVPWAFIFERVDQYPRHPGQLYEAIAYAMMFPVLWYFYKKHPERIGNGFFFGLTIFMVFTFRFFIEYTKEIQVAFEAGLPLDMGQILSIPFIIAGAYFAFRKSPTPNPLP